MLKKNFLFFVWFLPIIILGQNIENKSSQNAEFISSLLKLSSQQLYDTANYYYKSNNYDTALICYDLLIKTSPQNANLEQQKNLLKSYGYSAIIYTSLSDYRTAYENYIKILTICEKYDLNSFKLGTYINIGIIYRDLKQYEIANQYSLKALDLCDDNDSITTVLILNNLGDNNICRGEMDSAYYYINKAVQISKKLQSKNNFMDLVNTIAIYYQKEKQYDSAFYYFRLSLDYSREDNNFRAKAINLSDIGHLFFELNNKDSAHYYIYLSNKIASENKFLSILADNYFTLSKIEESKGNIKKELEYYKQYASLKDSISNAEVFNDINSKQRLYEISKTNQQIEKLVIDRQIKDNKIRYQKIILFIVLAVLLLVVSVLAIIFFQKKKLNKAYNDLVNKNVEIIELKKDKPETETDKTKKKYLSDSKQDELLKSIVKVMNNISIICDPNFSMDTLAELVHSNEKYITEALKVGLNDNFSSYLSSCRVREAQRLFSELDPTKCTVENVAHQVGFKSRNTFNEAFKEITKVSPGFYFKSIHKQKPPNS